MSILDVVTMRVGEALIGVDTREVDDVFHPRNITPAPMAAPDVLGVLNLRGVIVTALCVRTRLGLDRLPPSAPRPRAVGVRVDGDCYGLVVDAVESVMKVDDKDILGAPGALDARWGDVVSGMVRLPDGLLLMVDVRRLVLAEAA